MPDIVNETQASTPNLSQTEALKRYRDRVTSAAKYRKEQLGLDETWENAIDLYRGKHFKSQSQEDQIAVNLTFANINVLGPSVAINYPKITVNARKPERFAAAAMAGAVINYWWRHYDFLPTFRDIVQDFLVLGVGWAKVGWRYEEAERPRDEEAIHQDYARMIEQADTVAEADPEGAADLPSNEEILDGIPTQETVTIEDRPYLDRVDPFDIVWDPDATRLHDAKWVAQKIVRPLEEVQADKRYEAKARKSLEADRSVNPEVSRDDRLDTYRRADVDRVTLWEFYDLRRGQMCLFSEQGDAFLVKPHDFEYPFGHPFVMLRNYDVPNYFAPIGDIEMIEPLQRELNKTRSQLTTGRRRYKRKFLARRSALGPDGSRALTSDIDNEIAYVADENRPFDEIVQPVTLQTMDAALYNYSETIENDIDRVSGVSDFMRGAIPETTRTATEAGMIQDAANARSADKLARVELAIREISERLLQLAQTYLEGEQVVRITGLPPALGEEQAATAGSPEGPAQLAQGVSRFGNTMWVTFSREEIEGEFDFEVEAGSTMPRNDTVKRAQGLEMLNALGPYMGPVVDPAKVITHVLRDSFGIQDPESFLAGPQPEQPPHSERIIETMNFKDLPTAARAQLLTDAGLPTDGVEGTIDEFGQATETFAKAAQISQAVAAQEAAAAAPAT